MSTDQGPATKKATAGWYIHPSRANTVAYWDGATWGDSRPVARFKETPDSIGSFMGLGIFISLVGSGLLAAGITENADWLLFFGWIGAAAGYTLVLVAVIAFGVRLGFRHVDLERQQRTGARQS